MRPGELNPVRGRMIETGLMNVLRPCERIRARAEDDPDALELVDDIIASLDAYLFPEGQDDEEIDDDAGD